MSSHGVFVSYIRDDYMSRRIAARKHIYPTNSRCGQDNSTISNSYKKIIWFEDWIRLDENTPFIWTVVVGVGNDGWRCGYVIKARTQALGAEDYARMREACTADCRWSPCCGGRRRVIPKTGDGIGESGRGKEPQMGGRRGRRTARQRGGGMQAALGGRAREALGFVQDNLWLEGIEPFGPKRFSG